MKNSIPILALMIILPILAAFDITKVQSIEIVVLIVGYHIVKAIEDIKVK